MTYAVRWSHLVEEMAEQLDVDEHSRCVGQFIRNSTEEDFGTEHVVFRTCATTFGLQSSQTELEDVQPLIVKHGMSG